MVSYVVVQSRALSPSDGKNPFRPQNGVACIEAGAIEKDAQLVVCPLSWADTHSTAVFQRNRLLHRLLRTSEVATSFCAQLATAAPLRLKATASPPLGEPGWVSSST